MCQDIIKYLFLGEIQEKKFYFLLNIFLLIQMLLDLQYVKIGFFFSYLSIKNVYLLFIISFRLYVIKQLVRELVSVSVYLG